MMSNVPYAALSMDALEEFRAIAYYRLSKAHKNKKASESDSIANQRKLIQCFLDRHPNIILVDEAQDDGYTGTNFNRPGFEKVLDAIKSGKVNCVIVKDLSRLGREYISVGDYIEQKFPDWGVRFIAINDDVDSVKTNAGDDLIVPIKNIMNESYCRELSKKLRNQFQIQRGNGEFLGAFASYGYCKSPDDKHKLIIDEFAAEVVKGIFSLKIKGYSPAAIAEYLNKELILPPSEYKKSKGLNYKSGFSSANQAKWSAVTVSRILTNPIYAGTLVQGKRGTPNFKVKRMRVRKEEEWSVVKDNHTAIIDPIVFATVQRMLQRDTRSAPEATGVYPLSGVLFCPDCGRAMGRRTTTKNGKKYHYYVCSTYKNGKGCSSHSIECSVLDGIVLRAIGSQVNVIAEMEQLLMELGSRDVWRARVRRLETMIAQKKDELEKNQDNQMTLYESLRDGIIDRGEFNRMKKIYSDRIDEAQQAINQLAASRDEAANNAGKDNNWVSQFLKFQGLEDLTREVVFTLVDKIYIHADKHVKIDFNYRNEVDFYSGLLQRQQREVS